MPRRRQPTARQVRLGIELRKLREAAGLKAREAAALLGADSVQMSQIEAGIAGVSEERVRRLAALYDCVDAELVNGLVAMATDRTRGWWEEYRGALPESFLDLSELEQHAMYRWDMDFLFIPGLLQIEDYSRALFADRVPALPEEDLDLRVRHRVQRRRVIEGPNPVPYVAIIHEAALRIRACDRAASRKQLAHVLDLSEADHITVRVVPLDLDSFASAGATMVYAGGTVSKLDTVVRDAPHGTVFIDAEAQLGTFRAHFHKVEARSLAQGPSRDLIHKLAKEL
ncbi:MULTISPECIES: helix-turn-helix domain-containing protein [Streptomyces]|uniref:Helix-turn-helix domain-containing protein n=2 Tax=Streptomyces griseoaurantiacus TaxID=68213 RepID=A0A7W2DZZ7_9ACTN|nr:MULTISPECIES: helix-turn-helix transcriptional regulator [Streptomyces]MBA5226128.1 helix-turn-helix domain-containing protein [Streptomyces griseoaurantiacus]MCF0088304.1 hypothetical protein [Streptomyces sp. MH192]MCF0100555.1 hypothetical protein [Streptomyces sp. MH191]MDX3089040.1 helix-turn-helix transcriptional regulator [Streptomyces sp. ME12-02E]MDX3330370.1 helix-turn-helix transcriptional regulator [Streptomyces sp. ME02-6978a]